MNAMDLWFPRILDGAGYLVGVAFLLATLVAVTHWAVRQNHLAPFGGWATFVRRWSDPTLKAIERRLVGAGGNPQHAPYWLMGGIVVGGLVLIELLKFILGFLYRLVWAAKSGPGGLLRMGLDLGVSLLMLALLVRVFSSWFGGSRYSKYIRWSYTLTDWLVEPIRRVLPTVGMFDLSPLVAWLVLSLVRGMIL
jgi:YggT family protein